MGIHGLMMKVLYPARALRRVTANALLSVLTWVSVYWFSRAGPAASLRIYYEVANGGEKGDSMDVPNAPLGVSYFPREISIPPRRHVFLSLSFNTGFLTIV